MLNEFCKIIDSENWVVLDTETTGLNAGEVCQIAVMDYEGKILVDSLVKPKNPIPPAVTKIHGITDDMVKDAPTWMQLAPTIIMWLINRDIVVYNADYDRRMMRQSEEVYQAPSIQWTQVGTWHCAMKAYAEYNGQWDNWRRAYKYVSLATACQRFKIRQEQAHSAIEDVRCTWRVSLALARAARTTKK